ncbi:MAG TPA: hypothetical protein VED18_05000, partial [Candidatus Sulfotelmatobacter sp.]|nr:hypothetical protein [Candidatus Sulfotelmatobacter sp.]
ILVTLAMVLWAVWFVVRGLAFAVRLLRHPPTGEGLVPAPMLRKVGAVLLVGVLAVLVATALVTTTLVSERESKLVPIADGVAHMETTIHHDLSLLHLQLSGRTRSPR